MKIYFDNQPITLQQLVQEYQNLEYRVYPIEDIILNYVDKDGNLYFTTRER